MIPLSTNASQTIGIVDMNNPKDNFIMQVDPALLKSWAEMVADTFAGDDSIYLSVHPAREANDTARVLAAAGEYGDPIQVVVCGLDNDDIWSEKKVRK